jgi:hypothetical protein
MSRSAPGSPPEIREDRPTSQADGQVDVVGAKLVGPAEVSEESTLPPPPSAYSVEISVPSTISKTPPRRVVGQPSVPAAYSVEISAPSTISKAPPPPVARQPSAPARASQLQSEKVVIAAPLSFAGSAARIWKLVRLSDDTWMRLVLGVAAVFLIALAWCFVLGWYLVWGIFLVPYRLIRRGSRKRKREALQHREMMAAIQDRRPPEGHR